LFSHSSLKDIFSCFKENCGIVLGILVFITQDANGWYRIFFRWGMRMENQTEETKNDGVVSNMTEDAAPVEISESSTGIHESFVAGIVDASASIVSEVLDLRNSIRDQPWDEEKKVEAARMEFSLKDGDFAVSDTIGTSGEAGRILDCRNASDEALLHDLSLRQVLPQERHPWTPSRQSTVSSMAGNSIGDDSNDDDPLTMELNQTGLANLGMSPMNASGNTDEKSVRSENTRPDPPSTILTSGIANRGSIVPEMPMDVYLNDENGAPPHDPPVLPAYESEPAELVAEDKPLISTEEVVAAARALANLSVESINGAVEDHHRDTSERNGEELKWDLDRTSLLAETPGAVTTRKFVSPNQDERTLPSNQVEFRRPAAHVEVPNVRTTMGADNLVLLPRVDEHRFFATVDAKATPVLDAAAVYGYGVQSTRPPQMIGGRNPGSGRRKIKLRLQEEVRNPNSSIKRHFRSSSLLGTIRKSSTRMLRFGGSVRTTSFDTDDLDSSLPVELYKTVDRGSVSICWFDGTSSLELQQHVRKSVLRKMQSLSDAVVELDDLRIFDESFSPPEGSYQNTVKFPCKLRLLANSPLTFIKCSEIVLSPFLPDGAQFVLRFSTTTVKRGNDRPREYDGIMTPMSIYSGRAPDSPSASPSPHLEKYLLQGLNSKQLSLLNSLNVPLERSRNQKVKSTKASRITTAPPARPISRSKSSELAHAGSLDENQPSLEGSDKGEDSEKPFETGEAQLLSEEPFDEDEADVLHSEDPIESRLREITNLLLLDRRKERNRRLDRRGEKRQVVFVVANYFVLFLAIIAISAELQARAPNWLKIMEEHLTSVQNCSENQEVLFECVSRGDFAGLIASILLWLSRSVATKRIFLFGFDTPKKLWTVVYESLVTSICWGISYLFIRRGMNPDTRPRFMQKYWKDAVYGSLAGFNAAFLKHILKNLIPEQVVEDALRERQLKILGWLPSFSFK
jgi:hypothetical protein